MAYADPILATMTILRADASVVDALGGSATSGTIPLVQGSEVSSDLAQLDKFRAIVVANAGAGFGIGENDYIPVSVRRLDVRCYGRTPHEANLIALAVNAVCKAWTPAVAGGAYVHSYRHTSGPVSFRDPDADWPIVVTTFQVQYADDAV